MTREEQPDEDPGQPLTAERIVRLLAAIEDSCVEDRDYAPSGECGLCGVGDEPYGHVLADPSRHEPHCPWRLARAYVTAHPAGDLDGRHESALLQEILGRVTALTEGTHRGLAALTKEIHTMTDAVTTQLDTIAKTEELDVATIKSAVEAINAKLAAATASGTPDLTQINAAQADLHALAETLVPPTTTAAGTGSTTATGTATTGTTAPSSGSGTPATGSGTAASGTTPAASSGSASSTPASTGTAAGSGSTTTSTTKPASTTTGTTKPA